MKSFKQRFWEEIQILLRIPYVKTLISNSIIKILKLGAFTGIKGFIISFAAKEAAEEVIEAINARGEYNVKMERAKDTINQDDRDSATDTLNDIMRS